MYTTGTAMGHNDLVDQLVDWLVNTVGWTQLQYSGVTSPAADTDVRTAVLRAPGALSGDEFFVYLETSANVGSGYYGVKIRGGADYDSSVGTSSQLLISPIVWLNLWNAAMDYWFIANDRRVIVIAKVNTSYVSAYMGLFLPFALPTEYHKPFLVAAPYSALNSYDLSNSANRFIADPGDQTMWYLNSNSSEWNAVQNHSAASALNVSIYGSPEAIVWPHRAMCQTFFGSISNSFEWNYNGMMSLRPLPSGDAPQFQTHILSRKENKAIGALEGVFGIGGFGRTSEQIVSLGSPPREFLVVQNIFRTTNRDYMAVELA